MPFTKIPLKQLIDRDPSRQNGFGWDDFVKIASLPKDKQPSRASLGRMYGKSEKTIKNWLERFDAENDKTVV